MIYEKCKCGRDKKHTCSVCLKDCCKICKCDCSKKKEFVNKPVKPAKTPAPLNCESKDWNSLKSKLLEDDETRKEYEALDISEERELLKMTAELWNKFVSLEKFHPDENNDFADGIHNLQKMISYRITAKEHPDIFPRKVKEE